MLAVQEADSTVLIVKDQTSGTTYLVDIGAEVSVLLCPPHAPSTSHPLPTHLYAANGMPINTKGSTTCTLHLNGHTFSGEFLLSDVRCPLIGADFLWKHR